MARPTLEDVPSARLGPWFLDRDFQSGIGPVRLVVRNRFIGFDIDLEVLENAADRDGAQFLAQENEPYPLEDVFVHHYAEMPDDLKHQLVAYQKFENWKESHR
jgi:hypothetical protein